MSPARQRNQASLFTGNFFLLFVGNFIVVVIYFLLMTTMAYYAVTSYSVDSALAGLTASIFLVGAVVGRIICGRYSGRIPLKTLGIVSLGIQIVMMATYFADVLGIAFLICVRFIHGFSFGIANTVLPAMAVQDFPPERIGEGTGYFMLSNSLGVGVGPLMSVLIVMGIDYSVLFIICLTLSGIALVSIVGVHPASYRLIASAQIESDAKQASHGKKSNPVALEDNDVPGYNVKHLKHVLESIIDISTFRLSFFMFLVAFSYSSLNAFINSYAIEQGMGFFAPFVFLVYSAVLLLSRPLTGKLMDRYGENAVLYPSIASMGIGLIVAAFAHNPILLLSCGIFMATGFGTCMSVGQATATKISTCGNTSLTISTFFLLCDGGCGIGPFMLGFIVSGAGYEIMYLMCALLALGALLYYHVVHGKRVMKKEIC